ncbi:ribose 5-phosphate isomerase B [Draconibacterium sp. IB214405]|uniref:ribose 5-phosphate isomerase B n=1 Tax=Draconibacterium sp. IB214405 TaxID=3097352 RepID=UPI002A116D72|nr:ribose 5-phosphate isomerase B [Draconibacterium sp. IB214405]MDX8337817.1 ribose 5-phosphate isomerase B [Draconibacterium sp. IB214405]
MKNLEGKVIALASDHAGFAKKQVIKKFLSDNNIAFDDLGSYTDESVDYPVFAHKIGDAIESGKYEIGISFCGSGQGISIAANKHQGVRSAVCWSPEIAALARQHNNANICAVPGRFVSDEEAIAIVTTFLTTDFEGGRHARRVDLIPVK